MENLELLREMTTVAMRLSEDLQWIRDTARRRTLDGVVVKAAHETAVQLQRAMQQVTPHVANLKLAVSFAPSSEPLSAEATAEGAQP